MNLSTQPYKGTRDFYPEDMKIRNWFFGKIRSVLTKCAYDEYNGPMLESLDLYIAKSGHEIANEQTYHFTDKGGRQLAIRPEMTPTVARMVAGKINELNFPLKWFSIPNLYRYEQPQRGRLREHWQVNVDIFGCQTYEADYEIIQSAIRLLQCFGADESMFRVHINNRRLYNDLIRSICLCDGEKAIAISKIIDKKNKIISNVYYSELSKLGLSELQIEKIDELFIMDLEQILEQCPESDGAHELRDLFTHLAQLELSPYCKYDFSVIRGLDYYTGTVFEVFDLQPENKRAMFGGGRYDNLVNLFQKNSSIPGVGFGFGDVTLENFLVSHDLLPNLYTNDPKVMIVRLKGIPYAQYVAISNTLFKLGVPNTIYIGDKKLAKQIDIAIAEHFTHILIQGEEELDNQTVKIKKLSTRDEMVVYVCDLSSYSW